MTVFAATYDYAPEHRDAREENKPRHREWLTEQVAAGRVLTVGPFTDGSGALLVVEADSADDARALLERDPHLERGLVAGVTIREWTPVFGALA